MAGGRLVIADRPGLVSPFHEDADDVSLDYLTIFPDYLAPLAALAHRQGDRAGPGRGARPRPAHLDARPPPHRRRHAVRRRRRHGDEAGALGRGVRRARPGRRHAGRPDARPAARSRRPWPASWPRGPRLVFACGRYEGIDQRVLDHAATRAEVVEVSLGDYVLNGGEVAALAVTEAVVRLLPGLHGQPRVDRGGVPRGRAAGAPRLHPAAVLARPGRARRAARRRPCRDRRLAGQGSPCAVRPSVAPTSCTRAGWGSGRSSPPSAATSARSSPSSARAGCRRRWPTRCSTSRRCTSRWRRSRRRWTTGPTTSSGSRAGSSAPCAAGSRSTPAQRSGTSAGSWSPPTSRAAGLGRVLLDHIQAVAPAEAASYVAVHRRPQRGQPADVQEGRVQPAQATCRPRPGAVMLTKRDSPRLTRLWQTRPSAQSAEGPPGDRPVDQAGDPRRASCHRGSPRRRPPRLAEKLRPHT